MATIGIILIVLGVAFIAIALIGAARETFKQHHPSSGKAAVEGWTALIQAVSELLDRFLRSPKWLTVFFAGLVLIGIGIWLASGGTIK